MAKVLLKEIIPRFDRPPPPRNDNRPSFIAKMTQFFQALELNHLQWEEALRGRDTCIPMAESCCLTENNKFCKALLSFNLHSF